ncbi:MAG: sigma-70 family RNA polymerase sigma factor [Planctomycetes bacterium]|nr:sigma-70 family RNA polymerase sigma factor [Planctomycetota bacterium]
MNDATTETLFLRYRETGDAQALALVFDRLAPELLLVAAHLAGGDLAEDLVQATFLDAIRQRARWDRSLRLAPWLVGLLGNHVREARRQRKRVPDRERLEERSAERPEAAAEANECLAAVHAAVERLPRHYRQVLSLRLVHGLDLQQIANSLGVPLGTVKVRMHRGLALLRRALPAGLAMTVAVLLSPGRGLAAMRQVVLGNAAVPTAGVAVGTGVLAILGGIVMKQGLAAVVAVVVLVAGWFAVRAGMAEPGSQAPGPEPAAVVAVVPPVVPSAQVDEVAPPAAPANGAQENLEGLDRAIEGVRGAPRLADVDRPREGHSAEWCKFPRTEFSLGWYVTFLPSEIAAATLVRNKWLNPEDMELSAVVVQQLDEMLTKVVGPQMGAFNEAQVAVAVKDMEELSAEIAWKPELGVRKKLALKSGGVEEIQFFPLAEEGGTRVFKTLEDGSVVSAKQTSLPGLMIAKRARSLLVREVGEGIIKWFESAGVCPRPAAEMARADMFAWASTVLK